MSRWARWVAAAGACSAVLWVLPCDASGVSAPPRSVGDVAGITADQAAVVTQDHRPTIDEADLAVNSTQAAVGGDEQALASARTAAATAAAEQASAQARLGGDRVALAAAVSAEDSGRARVERDRAGLRSIAIGMYTGQLTRPQPAGLRALEAAQQAVIDAAEVQVIAGIVTANLRTDTAVLRADRKRRAHAAMLVADDAERERNARAASARAHSAEVHAEAALRVDQQRLALASRALAAAQAGLAAALALLRGPAGTPPGQLSVLGGSALTPQELSGWFHAQGYVDLTSAPVEQLADWYVQEGSVEGVRGDVAFAQAVLETAGFSSPDAAVLSNFAGIGHCDTCAAGWTFPSPRAGVTGQLQLLRIFADSGGFPAGAPGPVLAALTPGKVHVHGCCSTWESLTGVWATDPTYGSQILAIYGSMLRYALGGSLSA